MGIQTVGAFEDARTIGAMKPSLVSFVDRMDSNDMTPKIACAKTSFKNHILTLMVGGSVFVVLIQEFLLFSQTHKKKKEDFK